MAENTAAQGSGALDATVTATIQKLIGEGIASGLKALEVKIGEKFGELAGNIDVVAKAVAQDKENAKRAAAAADASKGDAAKPADGANAVKPLTAEDVAKLVSETISNTLKTRDEAAASNAARSAFIAEKLKGLPAPYQNQLGTDPAKWAEQEAAIRSQFQADLKAVGATIPDVKGTEAGGESGSGGRTPGQPNPAETAAATGNLSPGQAAFAAGIVLPKH